MSRCFPFPPSRYIRNGACSEDLIKSIKLQKERDEAKEQQKKDRRKKKEKRKERKERKEKEANAAHHSDGKGKECKLKDVESFQLEKITEQGSGCLQKVGDEDNELNERSAITEEHDQPFCSAEPCCLSDSTQTSNKRKRSVSPTSSDHGTAIKIRLPLRKHREHDELQQDYQAGSTESKGITKAITEEESRHQLQGRRNYELEHKGNQYLTSAGVVPSTKPIDHPKPMDSKRGRKASLYNSLFQNWNSCALQLKGFELEDQDWWLSTSQRQEETQSTKKVKSVGDALGCSSSTLWPRAQYLPEADIYGLPYTVPF